MKRLSIRGKTAADNFSFAEKIIAIYLDLHIAKSQVFKRIDKAFYQKKISAASRASWKSIFEEEISSCTEIQLNTDRDYAYLEFKARYLIHAAENLHFDRNEPLQGVTISL